MLPVLNILNLKRRTDRKEAIIKEMQEQGVDYKIWCAIEFHPPKMAISRSHKKIIQWAKENNQPFVVIGEDDIQFTSKGAYEYFISKMPESFDLYMTGNYKGEPDENFRVKSFSSMSLYVCHSRFYDTFLSVPENKHIDVALSMIPGEYYFCNKMCCIQKSGYSDNVKRVVDYKDRLVKIPQYNG